MRTLRFILLAAASLAAVSCGKTVIRGAIADAPETEIIVKQLAVNTYTVIDTVKTDKGGNFSCKIDIAEGEPEFVYLFKGDKTLASLLLERGDAVSVSADTLGNYTVEGSEESVRLQQVNKDFADFMRAFSATADRLYDEDLTDEEAKEVQRQLSRQYIDYYRGRLRYIIENPKSMTVVPVLYQQINSAFPVFSQPTDALQFRAVSDSLRAVYPKSKYVRALSEEAKRREDVMAFNARMAQAEEMPFPDIEMPDQTGKKVKLSEVDAKVILVEFWDASNADQKMLNQDVLKPLYEEFHAKGLEIFQVGLTQDKAVWATVVKSQGLEWVSVNDGLGVASQSAVSLYNVSVLPMAFLIVNGELTSARVSDSASLRREVAKYL